MSPHPAAFAAVGFLAAFAQGVTGFGSALVAMPLLAFFVDVRVAAPLVSLLSLAVNLAFLVPARRRLPWRRVAPLLAGSLVAIPPGVLFLARADARLARATLGAVLVVSALLLLRRRAHPVGAGAGPALAAGAAAGLLGGAFNASGPPLVLYAAARCWPKRETHAVLQLYFLTSNVVVIASQALAGLVTTDVARGAAATLPGLAAGAVAGWAVHCRVSEERFRRLVLVGLLAAGASLLLAK